MSTAEEVRVAGTACACGNEPLTERDLSTGGQCKCCREGHLAYHDDQSCRRCGCPLNMWKTSTWALWGRALPGARVSFRFDGGAFFGSVAYVSQDVVSVAWDHVADATLPGNLVTVLLDPLLDGEDGWRLLTKADGQPRDIGCIIKAAHDPHRYRPEEMDWPVTPYDPNGWLDCPGLEDLAGYDTFN